MPATSATIPGVLKEECQNDYQNAGDECCYQVEIVDQDLSIEIEARIGRDAQVENLDI